MSSEVWLDVSSNINGIGYGEEQPRLAWCGLIHTDRYFPSLIVPLVDIS